MRRQVRHQNEAVASIRLHITIDLFGHLPRSPDELLAAGHFDDQLADRQVFGFRSGAPRIGDLLGVAVPDPPSGDVRVLDGLDVGQGPVGIVGRKVHAATPVRGTRSRLGR
jgi:hypothetical protein